MVSWLLCGMRAVVISVITPAEVLTDFEKADKQRAAMIPDCFPVLELTKPVSDLAADLRRVHGWKLPDAFQAALAQHHHLRFATRNTRDFPPERHAFVVLPYKL